MDVCPIFTKRNHDKPKPEENIIRMAYAVSRQAQGEYPPNKPSSNRPTDDQSEGKHLRDLGHKYASERQDLAARSRAAYASGSKALASQLSTEAKTAGAKADEYHRQAREYYFRAHNVDKAGDEIDLHGLYANEVEEVLGGRIRAERARGNRTGGLHV